MGCCGVKNTVIIWVNENKPKEDCNVKEGRKKAVLIAALSVVLIGLIVYIAAELGALKVLGKKDNAGVRT